MGFAVDGTARAPLVAGWSRGKIDDMAQTGRWLELRVLGESMLPLSVNNIVPLFVNNMLCLSVENILKSIFFKN
jgi:hypothetical protein